MKKTPQTPVFRSLRRFLGATALGLLATVSSQALAADPIKLGVIAEAQAIAGASIPQAANWPRMKSMPRAASMAA